MAAENGGAPPLLHLSKARAILAPCSAPSGDFLPFQMGCLSEAGTVSWKKAYSPPWITLLSLCGTTRGCRRRVEALTVDRFLSPHRLSVRTIPLSASAFKSRLLQDPGANRRPQIESAGSRKSEQRYFQSRPLGRGPRWGNPPVPPPPTIQPQAADRLDIQGGSGCFAPHLPRSRCIESNGGAPACHMILAHFRSELEAKPIFRPRARACSRTTHPRHDILPLDQSQVVLPPPPLQGFRSSFFLTHPSR